jgi:hypothetical protein
MRSMGWPGCYMTWETNRVPSSVFGKAGSVSSGRPLIMLPRLLLPYARRVYEWVYREQAQA